MIMLMYTIEIVILMFVVTVLIALLAIFFIMKKSKQNTAIKIISVLTILVLTWIGGMLWMWGPLPGYTKEFKENGNPLTNYELIGYKNEKFHNAGGGVTLNRKVTLCMSQQDFDTDAKYLNSIKMVNFYTYDIYSNQEYNCKLVNMSRLKVNTISLRGFSNYELSKLGEKDYVGINLNSAENEFINFKNNKIKNVALTKRDNKDKSKFTFKLNLEGVENLNTIAIEADNGETYRYNIRRGDLNLFLHDWGYLDANGYNGKKYVYPVAKLKKTEF